jgi:5-methylcytosine-specific restriction endonuclease McrA
MPRGIYIHKPLLEEHKKNLRLSHLGKGHPISEDTKKKIGLANKGKPNPYKGKKRSEEIKLKLKGKVGVYKHHPHQGFQKGHLPVGGGAKKGNHPKTEFKKGSRAWNKGKHFIHSKSFKSGNQHINWCGGKSFEEYGFYWTAKLREIIRSRDNYICQECGIHQDKLQGRCKKLDVHHIDYNKFNLNPENLITLCRSCHIKTNYNRDYWIKYFNGKLHP